MLKRQRFIFLLVLVSSCLMSGCTGGTTNTDPIPTNSFQVVVFSDVHFNPFDDTTLFPALVSSDPDKWAGIFKGSKKTTLPTWNNDTNYPLLVLALSSIKQNLGASPVIIFTGDMLEHNFPKTFYQLYGSQDQAAMHAFTDKTVAFLTQQVKLSVGNIPVMFAVGNMDSYLGLGPDSIFLSNNAESFYTQFLNGSVDHQTFLSTFTSGGYYSAQPLGTNLMVISLNTNPFAAAMPGNNDLAVDTELAWLESKLASAKTSGQKVWLLMHVPPGVDTGTTAATNLDQYGRLSTATMMWKPEYQDHFMEILSNYPGMVTLALAAHTHMDEYRVLTPYNVLVNIVPAISPWSGDDPAFKVFTITQDTFTATDYKSLNYDLVGSPEKFNSFYTFSAAYSKHGPLGSSLTELGSELLTNNGKQSVYQGLYESGHNSASPITPANWPVYACGVENVTLVEFVNCVDSF